MVQTRFQTSRNGNNDVPLGIVNYQRLHNICMYHAISYVEFIAESLSLLINAATWTLRNLNTSKPSLFLHLITFAVRLLNMHLL